MPDPYIHEINLNTGVARRVARSEVSEETLTQYHSMLLDALADRGRMVEIPQTIDCAITATRIHRALLATLWSQGTAIRASGRSCAALATLAVVSDPQDSASLWRILHAEDPRAFAPESENAPASPWLAVRQEYQLLLHHEVGCPLDAIERGIAWAWLELSGRT